MFRARCRTIGGAQERKGVRFRPSLSAPQVPRSPAHSPQRPTTILEGTLITKASSSGLGALRRAGWALVVTTAQGNLSPKRTGRGQWTCCWATRRGTARTLRCPWQDTLLPNPLPCTSTALARWEQLGHTAKRRWDLVGSVQKCGEGFWFP